jgi:glycosyltransferase involved in cell wall biosynthesis
MTQDILCFSHLRWDFVYQRPQHLMNLLARDCRVFFVEEPIFDADPGKHHFDIHEDPVARVNIFVPHLAPGLGDEEIVAGQRNMLAKLLQQHQIVNYIAWYYSPMAWPFTDLLRPAYTVYDCMDELSAFLFAPPALKMNELALINAADIVFTGGRSLYEAKKRLHSNIHCFPSSIDKDHFHSARKILDDPEDQRKIPHPRIGFYGVIDERMNTGLLDEVSAAKPDWQFILVGPVVKIDQAILPRRPNIHYPGPKRYAELPAYLSGWDIAMMPFSLNASTKFISPTKTPEYLAAGKPVISPSIADVVDPYGESGLVWIADTAEEFIAAAEKIIQTGVPEGWLARVDNFLSGRSWERTASEMAALIGKGKKRKKDLIQKKTRSYV